MFGISVRKYVVCTKEEKLSCAGLISEIVDLAKTALYEDVFALENMALEIQDALLETGIMQIVGGYDAKLIADMLDALIVTSGKTGAELLRQLIIREGVLHIRSGLEQNLVKEKLLAMLGEEAAVEARQLIDSGYKR